MAAAPAAPRNATDSKTVTDTVVGEHTHTIVGYSLIKGIGDGEPIASERFTVGGHEWVLLFYPDGKRSSTSDAAMAAEGAMHQQQLAAAAAAAGLAPPVQAAAAVAAAAAAAAAAGAQYAGGGGGGAARAGAGNAGAAAPAAAAAAAPGAAGGGGGGAAGAAAAGPAGAAAVPAAGAEAAVVPAAPAPAPQALHHQLARMGPPRRDTTNEYAALFVALIGEGPNPQGVVNTNEGKVVRAFHRFTLVDQSGQGRDLTKGRTRDAGAVKISCARQDPNARNCHGYRKFVKRNILEDASRGYLKDDTIVIKYTIELVVSTGGALSRAHPNRTEVIKVPPPTIGSEMGALFRSGINADYTVVVESKLPEEEGGGVQTEEIKVHRFMLEARSPFFRGMLESNMAEALQGRFVVREVLPPVAKAVLHFIYTDSLPDELEGSNLEVHMAQHLLAAADMWQLTRLRRICERRLCESVDIETAATTLALADQNHAEELKRVCLDFVSRHLAAVMDTEGYRHMLRSCPSLQTELLAVIAQAPSTTERIHALHRAQAGHVRPRAEELQQQADDRRVRQRRME